MFSLETFGQDLARDTRGKRGEPNQASRRRACAPPQVPSHGASAPGQVALQFLSRTAITGRPYSIGGAAADTLSDFDETSPHPLMRWKSGGRTS